MFNNQVIFIIFYLGSAVRRSFFSETTAAARRHSVESQFDELFSFLGLYTIMAMILYHSLKDYTVYLLVIRKNLAAACIHV